MLAALVSTRTEACEPRLEFVNGGMVGGRQVAAACAFLVTEAGELGRGESTRWSSPLTCHLCLAQRSLSWALGPFQ